MKSLAKSAAAALLLVGLSACAAGSGDSATAAQGGSINELVLGFWHGLIGPITLIGEIIETLSPSVLPWDFRFYEVRDTGVLYDCGFFVGLLGGPSILFGASRRR